jgi:hypothetical protein
MVAMFCMTVAMVVDVARRASTRALLPRAGPLFFLFFPERAGISFLPYEKRVSIFGGKLSTRLE